MTSTRQRWATWAVILGWAAAPATHAAMLGGGGLDQATQLYSATEFVQGSSADVTTLKLSGAGTLTFVLTDLQFPDAFAALSFAVTDTDKRLASMTGPGTMNLAV